MKLVHYYRVSTKQQGDSGLGLEAQQAATEEFRSRTNSAVVAEFTEVETGTSSKRPQLAQAIRKAKQEGATLVVAKLDRLARSVSFTSALMDSGLEFVCCDMPDANKFTIHILAAVAENEAELIRKRTKAALQAAKARGTKLGSARPGHWDGREHLRGWAGCQNKAEVCEAHRQAKYGQVLPIIKKLREHGESFKAIAIWLNESGYKTSRGNNWGPSQVQRLAS